MYYQQPKLSLAFYLWILNIYVFALPRPALQDKRYSINKLSQTKFIISISKITFKDGGNYTCSQYGAHTTEKKVEVTVLGEGNDFVTDCIIV